jgi:cold shock CspA family protein
VIKSFDPAKGYGFIDSVPGLGRDVYFKAVDGETPPSKGETVSFVLNWSKDGKPQAANITRALADGEPMRGTVKSYNAKNGYGFVCVEGSSQDVYFKKNALPPGLEDSAADGSLVGATVRFVVKLLPDGKPQLRDLILEESTANGAAAPQGAKRKAFAPPEPAAAKRPRVMTAPPAVPAGGHLEEAPEEVFMQLHGVIKSFNPQKGYGFISSEEVEGDVWFRKATLPEEHREAPDLAGQEVIFGLTHAKDGKPQAGTIEVIGQAFE